MELNENKEPQKEIQEENNSAKKVDIKAAVADNPVFRFIKKKAKLLVVLLVVILVAVTALQVHSAVQDANSFSVGETQSFEEVSSKDISNSISVTGTIASSESRTLSTLVSKTEVTDVFVEVGDYVKVGDPICTFDTSSIESNIRKVERQITVNNAKATLNLAKANTQVAWAMEDYIYNQHMGDYDLDAAMRNYVEQQNQVANSIDDLNAKERELDDIKDEYHKYKRAKNNGTVSEGNYKSSGSEYREAITSAEEAVSAAGRSVENAQLGLQNSIDNYNKAVETLQHQGVTDLRTISNNMASVVETELNNMTTNDEAEEQIREYEKSLDNCNITAPISGIVTSVSVVEGDEYDEKSTICVIQDDSEYKVTGTVDQYDISKISESMNCVIKTDATGDDQMEGVLTFVSPVPGSSSSSSSSGSGESSSGSSGDASSTGYPIEITIKGRDDRLRIGMTAEASILIESREGVKAVPYDAIEEDSDGNCYLNVAVTDGSAPFGDNDVTDGSEASDMVLPTAGEARFDSDEESGSGPDDMPDMGSEKPDFAGPEGRSESIKDKYSANPIANFIAERILGMSASELYTANAETPTRRVSVKKGLETDYYTEIISDEVKVGDQVLIPDSGLSDDSFGGMMGGPGRGPGRF